MEIRLQVIIMSTFQKSKIASPCWLFLSLGPISTSVLVNVMCRWFCGKMHFPELLQVGSLKLDVNPVWPGGCMCACLCKWSVGSRLE